MHPTIVCNLGTIDYKETWELQETLVKMRQRREIEDVLLLLEHDPVFTIGRHGTVGHILVSEERLEKEGIGVYKVNRGGDITYHGPGQIVAYPIFDLHNYYEDLHWYSHQLEEVVIRVLKNYHVTGQRIQKHPGVWVGNDKVAALGVGVKRWITMHGFAFNIDPNFNHFTMIIPCGIMDKGVISLKQAANCPVSIEEVMPQVIQAFKDVFELKVIHYSKETLMRRIGEWKENLNG